MLNTSVTHISELEDSIRDVFTRLRKLDNIISVSMNDVRTLRQMNKQLLEQLDDSKRHLWIAKNDLSQSATAFGLDLSENRYDDDDE